MSGLDLGEVEDVVDDREQRVRGGLDHLEIAALLGKKIRIERQFGHSEDGIHGSSDLVAHVGEELPFGPVGRLRGFAGLPQLRFDGESGGKIGQDQAGRLEAAGFEWGHRGVHRDLQAIAVDEVQIALAVPPFSPAEQPVEEFAVARGHVPGQRRADDLAHGLGEHLADAAVAEQDDSTRIQDDRPLAHLLEEVAVGEVGPFDGVDPLAVWAADDQRIDLPGSDGADRLLGLLQPRLQVLDVGEVQFEDTRVALHIGSLIGRASSGTSSGPRAARSRRGRR